MKKLCLGLVATVALVAPALAESIEYPAYVPYPFQRAHRTRHYVRLVPYERPFVVRRFTTPQQPPYYNVPAYRVISPY